MIPEKTRSPRLFSSFRPLAAALAGTLAAAGFALAAPDRAGWDPPAPAGGAGERWVHVRYEGRGDEGTLRLDLPLALVESAAPLLETGRLRGGRIRLEGSDATAMDLRALWRTVRRAGEGEIAVLEDGEGRIRVSREGGHVVATVSERGEGGSARLRVPFEVVDALFTGEPDELNLAAALRLLGSVEGDLIVATDGEGSLRIWVDDTGPSD